MPIENTDDQLADSSTADSQGEDQAGSPAADQDVDPAGSSSASDTGDVSADSPPADGDKELSATDVVENALAPEDAPPSEDGETPPAEATPTDETPAELPDEVSEDELKDVNPRTAQRIEQLLGQRVDLRRQVETLTPGSEQWDAVENFRKAQGMQPEHVANAIQIAALIENEPQRAFQVVDQLRTMLGNKVGAVLPDDLRDAVQKGEITRERAFELSQAKAGNTIAEQRRVSEAERSAGNEQDRALQTKTNTASATSTEWDRERAVNDPDWQLKRGQIASAVELRLVKEGIPDTAEAMRAILDAEAEKVNKFAGMFRPAGKTVKPTPGSAPAREAAPRKAKDHFDVVEIVLGG